MKILVLGGMHGNEPLGLEVVKLLEQTPVANVDVMLANEEAIKENVRFTSKDLNRSFPGTEDGTYEDVRAQQILSLAKEYDLVLDFHNTYCPGNDCGFIGAGAYENLYDISSALGLKRIVVADYDCVNKYAPNCLSVEISMDSPANVAQLWYERIVMLSELVDVVSDARIELYKFVYRMTLEDRDMYDLTNKKLKAFEPLDEALAKKIGVTSPAYPIFIGDKFTPYNYGGLLNKFFS